MARRLMEEIVKGPQKLFVLVVFGFVAIGCSATDIYIAQTAAGANNGADCADAYAVTWFNNSANWGTKAGQIVPGTTVHLCGTFTGSAGGTMLVAQGSGASGNPITLLFESGAQFTAPYWSANGGAINSNGKNYITINGGTNGIIQNTANGDKLANQQISTLIYATGCSNCTVENLTLANDYVAVQNQSTLGGTMTQMNAIVFSGSNWVISGNIVHDCGWCLYNNYGNGDANIQIYNNEIYNWDHAYMLATAAASSLNGFYFHDNNIHDNVNFETPSCIYHLDGIHFFGTNGSSMDQIYVYNNWWHGALSGACSSGFLFAESTASSTPAHILNSYWWNNVFDATGADGMNPNGWVGIFSSSASITFINNTLLYNNTSDGTNCYNIGSANNLTFQDNTVNGCTYAVNLGSLTGANAINYNFYGDACNGSNNCFIWNGAFKGSFSAWKAACACDGGSLTSTYSGAKLNSNGAPQSGSPVINMGTNLSSDAYGNLGSLANDTSQGNIRTPLPRPSGSCSQQGSNNCWDVGAYQYASSAPLNPPTDLTSSVH
jgi:hypothetical protein